MGKNLRISSYIRKPFLIYDFAPDPHLNFLIYEENFVFFFISLRRLAESIPWTRFLGSLNVYKFGL